MKKDLPIINEEPGDWHSLQDKVALLLMECGFHTEIEKEIDTTRGKVEIDVYAQKQQAFVIKLLVECKYWTKKVPQTVIHSFRTVVGDYGANQGFIISMKGFQKGAYEAAQKTNVSLLNWSEFLDQLKLEWLKNVIDRNYKRKEEFFLIKNKIIELTHENSILSEHQWKDFDEIRKSNDDFLFLSFKEHYLDLETREISLPEITQRIKHYGKLLPFKVSCYREYFNGIYEICGKGLNEMLTILAFVNDHLK